MGQKAKISKLEKDVKFLDKDFIAGQFNLDRNFNTANKLFKQFEINL